MSCIDERCDDRLISHMSRRIIEHVAVKYVRPCSAEDCIGDRDAPDYEYRRVVKHNYSSTVLSVFVDTIGMIKSLAALLLVCARPCVRVGVLAVVLCVLLYLTVSCGHCGGVVTVAACSDVSPVVVAFLHIASDMFSSMR
jgi:hypothetical protein